MPKPSATAAASARPAYFHVVEASAGQPRVRGRRIVGVSGCVPDAEAATFTAAARHPATATRTARSAAADRTGGGGDLCGVDRQLAEQATPGEQRRRQAGEERHRRGEQ